MLKRSLYVLRLWKAASFLKYVKSYENKIMLTCFEPVRSYLNI